MPPGQGWVCPVPKIYGRPRGLHYGQLQRHTSSLSQAMQRSGTEKQARAVKNGAQMTPSGTWPDAEGDIN